MLFNPATGLGVINGHATHEWVWDAAVEPLPDWFEIIGVNTLERLGVDVSRGVARITIPSNDTAVILRPRFDIKTDEFTELTFCVFSLKNQVSQQLINLRWGDETIGAAMYRDSTTTPDHYAKVFPAGAERKLDYVWTLTDGNYANYATNPKNLGITVRPRDKEVIFLQGDHMNGDAPVWMTQGEWIDGVMRPSIELMTSSTQTQQRYVEFSKIKLRLAHW